LKRASLHRKSSTILERVGDKPRQGVVANKLTVRTAI
jgi:hypothetical protein